MGPMDGSIAALITPFDRSGQVDFGALKDLVKWHVQCGTDGLILCGSTGEGTSLSIGEKQVIFEAAQSVGAGKIALIGASGTNLTSESVVLTQMAKECGLDGCMAIVPYYNRPKFEGCFLHFSAIAEVGLPLIVYHHPGRTGTRLAANELAKICAIEGVAGLKDASADLSLVAALVHEGVSVYCGDDELALPYFSLGAVGSISIVANVIPTRWKEFVSLAKEGRGREAFFALYDLIRAMTLETNPQCVKFAVSHLGKCSSTHRLPLLEPSEENQRLCARLVDQFCNESRPASLV